MRGFMICMMYFTAMVFYQEAWSKPPKTEDRIAAIFKIAEEQDYSTASLKTAAQTLAHIDDPSARAAELILLQFGDADYEIVKPKLQILADEVNRHIGEFQRKYPNGHWPNGIDVSDYDGSVKSIIDNLIEIRKFGRTLGGAYQGWQSLSQFTLPCSFFIKYPKSGHLSHVLARGDRYNQPAFHIGCDINYDGKGHFSGMAFEKRFPNLMEYWKQGKKIAPWPGQCGSMSRDIAAAKWSRKIANFFYPDAYLTWFNQQNKQRESTNRPRLRPIHDLTDTPYMEWALVGRANYHTFLQWNDLYRKARDELEKYYQDVFQYDAQQSRIVAAHQIYSQTNYGGFVVNNTPNVASFSRALKASLDGQRNIRLAILKGERISQPTIPDSQLEIDYYEKIKRKYYLVPKSGSPEPLMHLATRDVQMMEDLLAAGYDINMRGALGKTPLMVAAQDDRLNAVTWLIAHGANINATSSLPFDIPFNENSRSDIGSCTPYKITTGHRTALMYAISESSKSTVLVLMAAGAHWEIQDSMGRNSVDYLHGRGSFGLQKLSKEDRQEILALIETDATLSPVKP